jgi:hypothetical protein
LKTLHETGAGSLAGPLLSVQGDSTALGEIGLLNARLLCNSSSFYLSNIFSLFELFQHLTWQDFTITAVTCVGILSLLPQIRFNYRNKIGGMVLASCGTQTVLTVIKAVGFAGLDSIPFTTFVTSVHAVVYAIVVVQAIKYRKRKL